MIEAGSCRRVDDSITITNIDCAFLSPTWIPRIFPEAGSDHLYAKERTTGECESDRERPQRVQSHESRFNNGPWFSQVSTIP